MSRLRKVALMSSEMFSGTLKQLGDKGRLILKNIEDYKFSLEQAARIVSNDNNLSQRLVEKKKELDAAAGQVYSIVFEIENIDITNEFQQQQQFVNNPNLKNQINNEQPAINEQNMNQPNNAAEDNNEPPSIGSGISGGPAADVSTPEDNTSENDETSPEEVSPEETEAPEQNEEEKEE